MASLKKLSKSYGKMPYFGNTCCLENSIELGTTGCIQVKILHLILTPACFQFCKTHEMGLRVQCNDIEL